MFFQLYVLLVAALVPAVGADYLLYRAFAEAGCAGAGEPLGVFFPGCTPSGKPDSGVKVACTSSTTYTLYGYSNDQCSGAPVANTPTNTSACAYKDFWTDSVCVTGDFDPVTPQAYFSIDRYQVFSPSGTSSACPPFGVGSHFSQRSYYPAAILGQKAVPGQCIPAPPNTEDVSLLFTCSSDGSYKYEMFGGRQCSGTAGVVSPAGCIARLNNERQHSTTAARSARRRHPPRRQALARRASSASARALVWAWQRWRSPPFSRTSACRVGRWTPRPSSAAARPSAWSISERRQ